jgi:hypothetical protein
MIDNIIIDDIIVIGNDIVLFDNIDDYYIFIFVYRYMFILVNILVFIILLEIFVNQVYGRVQ